MRDNPTNAIISIRNSTDPLSIMKKIKDTIYKNGLRTELKNDEGEICRPGTDQTEFLASLIPAEIDEVTQAIRAVESDFNVRIDVLDAKQVEWFPLKEKELDLIGNVLIPLDANRNPGHPVWCDEEYQKRRQRIGSLASTFRMGQPIPEVDYSPEEHALWGSIYRQAREIHEKVCCQEYLQAIHQLERLQLFSSVKIPQTEELSMFLKSTTNFQIKPVHGMLSQREFLNCLAFRTFCSTQYIRHVRFPEYSPEPDLVHEYLGHIPNLMNPVVADISQKIGILSLGVSDEQIRTLGSIYFFTIEFGLCMEGSSHKLYGAGPCGSFEELRNIARIISEGLNKFKKLDILNESLPIDLELQDLQPYYYVADSFDSFLRQLDEYANRHKSSLQLEYNEKTNSFTLKTPVIRKKLPSMSL